MHPAPSHKFLQGLRLMCRRASKFKVIDCQTISFAELGLRDNVALLVLLQQRDNRPGVHPLDKPSHSAWYFTAYTYLHA
jgi:hypothetical protein